MGRVTIGMDPHKRSATIDIIDERQTVLAQGRFGTDRDGYRAMLTLGRRFPDRVWAVEGCGGIGRHIAQRLVADGETVLDVPAKLSAQMRVFALGQARVPAVTQLHHLLLELVPGGAKKFLSAAQARALLNTVRPRDVVGRTRRQLASELITELAVLGRKIKAANKQLTELVEATGNTLQHLNGIGPSGAARLIGDIGATARFPTAGHFASWNGTAPIEASSGDQLRHRLSLVGDVCGPARRLRRRSPCGRTTQPAGA